MEKNPQKPRRRWVRGTVNLVVPVVAAERFGADATHARDAIRTAWRELMERIRLHRARERSAVPVDIIIPSAEDAAVMRGNARVVWWVGLAVAILGLALAAMVIHSSSVLTVINAGVTGTALVTVGVIKALDAARTVAELRMRRPIGWKEFRRNSAWFVPY